MDFTFSSYKRLLTTLQTQGYAFQAFEDFLEDSGGKAVILRHDVDKLPENALQMARLEEELGIRGSYYFRVVPWVWDEAVMGRIVELGHELGYHFEDMAIAKGDHVKAIRHFEMQLERFRRIYPVKTICMHGSPLLRYANRDLWQDYDYRDFSIIGEPYFDVDFNEVFYITDTGRKWNHTWASVQDRVKSGFDIQVKNTFHLMALAKEGALPPRLMMTVHPQRWHDKVWPWIKELVGQNIKNIAKTALINLDYSARIDGKLPNYMI